MPETPDSRSDNPPDETPAIDFEGALGELEQLVEELERGDLSLEASLAAFERGIGLTRQCQQALRDAEQRVRILTAEDDDAELEELGDSE